MASTTFLKILQKANLKKASENASDWFRRTIASIGIGATLSRTMDVNLKKGFDQNSTVDSNQGIRNIAKTVSVFEPGQMICYYYDAKTKDQLKYWDAFPLIFPFRIVEGGFYGINFHYLHPFYRAKLLDALSDTASNKFYNESTKLNISYEILRSAAKYRYFKPCVKRYLNSHVKSQFLKVDPQFWSIALMMPLASFKKASQETVWAESQEQF